MITDSASASIGHNSAEPAAHVTASYTQALIDRDMPARPRLAISIDLVGCDARAIGDLSQIRRFAIALCDLLAMPFGEPIVARLGDGCSLLRLHEGSVVSGHFDTASGDVYIDIFSCQPYSPYQAAEFCRGWLGAASMRINVVLRLAEGTNVYHADTKI